MVLSLQYSETFQCVSTIGLNQCQINFFFLNVLVYTRCYNVALHNRRCIADTQCGVSSGKLLRTFLLLRPCYSKCLPNSLRFSLIVHWPCQRIKGQTELKNINVNIFSPHVKELVHPLVHCDTTLTLYFCAVVFSVWMLFANIVVRSLKFFFYLFKMPNCHVFYDQNKF